MSRKHESEACAQRFRWGSNEPMTLLDEDGDEVPHEDRESYHQDPKAHMERKKGTDDVNP